MSATGEAGQPLAVALLGVVITMVASRSVNETDPRRQRITMALAHSTERYASSADSPEPATAFTAAAARTQGNIDALIAAIGGSRGPAIVPATEAGNGYHLPNHRGQ